MLLLESVPWEAGWIAAELAAGTAAFGLAVVARRAARGAPRWLRRIDAVIAVEVGVVAMHGPSLSWCGGSGWVTPHGFPLPWLAWSGVSSLEYDYFAVPFAIDLAVYASAGFLALRLARGRWGAVLRVAVAAGAAPLFVAAVASFGMLHGGLAVTFDRPVVAVRATLDGTRYDDPRCPVVP